MLVAGVNDFKELGSKKTLWNNLILNQQVMLKTFLDKVDAAQDMDQLEEVVNEAIERGVRFNFPHQEKLYRKMHESKYSFMDYVIKRISELKKNPEIASNIVCELISKGAVLYNINSMNVLNMLESEFKDHKTNMIQAYEYSIRVALDFMEIVKNASTGEVKDAKIDNSTLYLEYSRDSTIHIAKITDGARDLGLTGGNIEYGRNIVKISNSEVEITTQKGTRNYTDLAEGSDIVLTFYTSLGELEVRLYPDENNKKLIRVEVSDEDLDLLDEIESCDEEIGQNCLLGGLSVIKAIDRGVFARSGGLMHSEVIGESGNKKVSWAAREEFRRISDFKGEIAR